MKTEQINFELVMKAPEKKLTLPELEFPKRPCNFCGRMTKHSRNGRICLVCGTALDSQ